MRTIAVFLENRPFFGALLVHAPLLHALRRRAPDARLVLFAPFAQADRLVAAGAADEAVLYTGRFANVLRALRRVRADEAFVLRPASRWLDLAVAAARVPVTAGYASWLGRALYTRALPHDTRVYRPRKYLALETGREAALPAPLDAWFRTLAPDAPAPAAGALRTLALLPGGGAGDFKRWGPGRFLELAETLAASDAALRFDWVLGPQEADWPARIAASAVGGRSRVLLDRPLPELAAAAFAAHAAVGNDCGPAHVFQMCGCPFACVMSDHDRQGEIRAAEWIDAANRPFATLSAPGAAIGTVPVGPVRERVRAALLAGGARAR